MRLRWDGIIARLSYRFNFLAIRGLDPELYQLSRAYPFLALAFALTPALGCRTVVDAAAICIVLILCGLFFIAG